MRAIVRVEIAIDIDLDDYEELFESLDDLEYILWDDLDAKYPSYDINILRTRKTIK